MMLSDIAADEEVATTCVMGMLCNCEAAAASRQDNRRRCQLRASIGPRETLPFELKARNRPLLDSVGVCDSPPLR